MESPTPIRKSTRSRKKSVKKQEADDATVWQNAITPGKDLGPGYFLPAYKLDEEVLITCCLQLKSDGGTKKWFQYPLLEQVKVNSINLKRKKKGRQLYGFKLADTGVMCLEEDEILPVNASTLEYKQKLLDLFMEHKVVNRVFKNKEAVYGYSGVDLFQAHVHDSKQEGGSIFYKLKYPGFRCDNTWIPSDFAVPGDAKSELLVEKLLQLKEHYFRPKQPEFKPLPPPQSQPTMQPLAIHSSLRNDAFLQQNYNPAQNGNQKKATKSRASVSKQSRFMKKRKRVGGLNSAGHIQGPLHSSMRGSSKVNGRSRNLCRAEANRSETDSDEDKGKSRKSYSSSSESSQSSSGSGSSDSDNSSLSEDSDSDTSSEIDMKQKSFIQSRKRQRQKFRPKKRKALSSPPSDHTRSLNRQQKQSKRNNPRSITTRYSQTQTFESDSLKKTQSVTIKTYPNSISVPRVLSSPEHPSTLPSISDTQSLSSMLMPAEALAVSLENDFHDSGGPLSSSLDCDITQEVEPFASEGNDIPSAIGDNFNSRRKPPGKDIHEMERKYRLELEKQTTALETVQDQHLTAQNMNSRLQEHIHQLAATNMKQQQRIAELKRQHDQDQDRLERLMAGRDSGPGENVSSYKELYEVKLVELVQKHKSEATDLKARHDHQLTELKREIRALKTRVKQKLDACSRDLMCRFDEWAQ